MILRLMGYEDIEFDDQSNTLFIVKNHQLYSHLLFLISSILYDKNKSNELLVLDDNKNITSDVLLVTDPYSIDFNSKSILKEMYALISNSITSDEDKNIQYQTLADNLSKLLDDELSEYNLEFDCKYDLTIDNYLKARSLKIVRSIDDRLYDRMIDYIELVTDLINKPVVVLFNCMDYLSDEELKELLKYKNYKHLHLLFIESRDRTVKDIVLKRYIIDEDLCENMIL